MTCCARAHAHDAALIISLYVRTYVVKIMISGKNLKFSNQTAKFMKTLGALSVGACGRIGFNCHSSTV